MTSIHLNKMFLGWAAMAGFALGFGYATILDAIEPDIHKYEMKLELSPITAKLDMGELQTVLD